MHFIKKSKVLSLCLIVCIPGIFLFTGCKKAQPEKFPSISTKSVITSITDYAESGGIIGNDGNIDVGERGVIWGTDPNLNFETAIGATQDGKGPGEFKSTMVFLDPNTTYFVRAYAITIQKILYGEIREFILSRGATVTTGTATSVRGNSAVLNGYVTPNNSSTIVSFQIGTGSGYFLTIPFSDSPIDGFSTFKASFLIDDLEPNTTYHFRIKGDNSAGTTFGRDTTFITKGVAKDIDHNTYAVIKIGDQTWFMDNLITTKYSNGDPINPSLTSGSYGSVWDYNNNNLQLVPYGKLYNYAAAIDGRNICPIGWHVPTLDEFNKLRDFAGGPAFGGNLKENSLKYWTPPNTGATNETEFTALPGGYRNQSAVYSDLRSTAYFMTTTRNLSTADIYGIVLSYSTSTFTASALNANSGLSVRCVKGTIPSVVTGSAKSITDNSAIVTGILNPNDEPATVTFDYGLTNSYGNSITIDGQNYSGNSQITTEIMIPGLAKRTQYHYRIRSSSQFGTAYGSDSVFFTKDKPVAITQSVVILSPSSVKILGKVTPNNSSTEVSFLFGETNEYGQTLVPGNNIINGVSPVTFEYVVTDLLPGKSYHYTIKAVNEFGQVLGSDSQFRTDLLQDIDGNYYPMIKIGDNFWMQKNLATTRFSNGDVIPEIQSNSTFYYATQAAYCNYNNSPDNGIEYGKLYNEYVAEDTRNVCPTGWYVPGPDLWAQLTVSNKEGELKETGTSHWLTTNSGVTNLTGFSALPGGYRTNLGFKAMGVGGFWWCPGAVLSDLTKENYAYIDTVGDVLSIASGKLSYGFSIRCVNGSRPIVKTGSVTGLTTTSATLSGTVNANSETAAISFICTSSAGITTEISATPATVDGNDAVKVSVTLTGLSPGITYNYKIRATNSTGTVTGRELKFMTPSVK